MKTSLQEKTKYIDAGSPIAGDLKRIFAGREDLMILDCGACDGLDSVIYSRLFPSAKIYAIEAREDNWLEMFKTFHDFEVENVKPIRACLDDCSGQSEFFSSFGDSGHKKEWDTGNKSSSIMEPTGHLSEHAWCKFRREKIDTIRFDALGIPRIDFIHLDVQGAELKVLGGMGTVLDTVTVIWLEVARVELYRAQPLARDIESFLTGNGFTKNIDTSVGRKFGDQLWVRQ